MLENIVYSNDREFFNIKPSWTRFHGAFGDSGTVARCNRLFKVYLYNNLPIAYVTYKKSDSDIYIEFLEVHPDFQNNGIGTFIMKEIFKEADAATENINLCSQYASVHFYEKLGFKITKPTRVGRRLMIKYLTI